MQAHGRAGHSYASRPASRSAKQTTSLKGQNDARIEELMRKAHGADWAPPPPEEKPQNGVGGQRTHEEHLPKGRGDAGHEWDAGETQRLGAASSSAAATPIASTSLGMIGISSAASSASNAAPWSASSRESKLNYTPVTPPNPAFAHSPFVDLFQTNGNAAAPSSAYTTRFSAGLDRMESSKIFDWLERIERLGQSNQKQLAEIHKLVQHQPRVQDQGQMILGSMNARGPTLPSPSSVASMGKASQWALTAETAMLKVQSVEEDGRRTSGTSAASSAEEFASEAIPGASPAARMRRRAYSRDETKAQDGRRTSSDAGRDGAENAVASKKSIEMVVSGGACLSKKQETVLEEFQTPMQKLVRGRYFELFSCILVFSNVMVIGYEMQVEAVKGQPPDSSTLTDALFCLFFAAELLPRIAAFGRAFFVSAWNQFDFILVTFMVMELAVSAFLSDQAGWLGDLSSLRVLRVVRLLRAIRIIRLMKFFRELRLLFISIVMSLRLLLWSAIAISLSLYMFAVIMTNGYISLCSQTPQVHECTEGAELQQKFGGIDRSMMSLYQAMANGISWADLVEILEPVGFAYQSVIVIHVTFQMLAILNVVTAIFVQAVMYQLEHDRESAITEKIHDRAETIKNAIDIFNAMDADGSGKVSLQEFHEMIHDERMVAFCLSQDLQITDPDYLFQLLDAGGTGNLDVKEFIDGFLVLRGHAQNIDAQKILMLCDMIFRRLGGPFPTPPEDLSDPYMLEGVPPTPS